MTSPSAAAEPGIATQQAAPQTPAIEVLEQLELHNTVTQLEGRVVSLELDIARASGARDDDARRVAGEMAVMRARVEDALTAFAQTTEEVRGLLKRADERASDPVVEAAINGVTAGVADVVSDLSGRMSGQLEQVSRELHEVRSALGKMAEAIGILLPVLSRLDQLEQTVAGPPTAGA